MEFVEFFTQMHYAVVILLVLCVVLLIIEAVMPGFGIWGISGIVCGVGAVVCEAIFTKSLFDVFMMIFLILLLFTIIFITFSLWLGKGGFKKTPFVETKSALPENYKSSEDLSGLVGKTGKVTSLCKPSGRAVIDGKVYPVRSIGENIAEGENVVVVEIKDNTILIKTKEEGNV